jgi:hypothetical protein
MIFTLSILSFLCTIVWWSQGAFVCLYTLFGRFWELGVGCLSAFAKNAKLELSEKLSFFGWLASPMSAMCSRSGLTTSATCGCF